MNDFLCVAFLISLIALIKCALIDPREGLAESLAEGLAKGLNDELLHDTQALVPNEKVFELPSFIEAETIEAVLHHDGMHVDVPQPLPASLESLIETALDKQS